MEELSALRIPTDLAVHYTCAGWLTRLDRGVNARLDTPLELYPSLQQLERRFKGLQLGGKIALDWHGVRRNVALRIRLFDEQPDAPLRVSALNANLDGPLASDPERAVLELLSDVGVRRPLQEARDVSALFDSRSGVRASRGRKAGPGMSAYWQREKLGGLIEGRPVCAGAMNPTYLVFV